MGFVFKGDPEYVRSACEASLRRLDVTSIDLYYQHRIDTIVPIEITALKDGLREKVELATKFGIIATEDVKFGFRGDPEYVRSACEASLKRLGVTSIDLY